jgi:methionyl-tRNA formyltransferase
MIHHGTKVIFFGTPEFAAAQLDAICRAGYDVVGVVTAADKPAGRGKKLTASAVKQYAQSNKLPVFQPERLKDHHFITQLKALKADVFIVVAFRLLPKEVWQLPPKGTFNLHASLLPQYRGAAPINRAIMNGETESGLTTFLINDEIDTGHILLQTSLPIGPEEDAGSLQDRMMEAGRMLVVQTIELVATGNAKLMHQNELMTGTELKQAPKIYRDDCCINWQMLLPDIHNQIRGLSPYPAAFSYFQDENGSQHEVKILGGHFEILQHGQPPLLLITDNRKSLKISHKQGYYHIGLLKYPGKKTMSAPAFLNGFKFNGQWQVGHSKP